MCLYFKFDEYQTWRGNSKQKIRQNTFFSSTIGLTTKSSDCVSGQGWSCQQWPGTKTKQMSRHDSVTVILTFWKAGFLSVAQRSGTCKTTVKEVAWGARWTSSDNHSSIRDRSRTTWDNKYRQKNNCLGLDCDERFQYRSTIGRTFRVQCKIQIQGKESAVL